MSVALPTSPEGVTSETSARPSHAEFLCPLAKVPLGVHATLWMHVCQRVAEPQALKEGAFCSIKAAVKVQPSLAKLPNARTFLSK